MPESSHMDVKPWTGIEPKSCSNGIGKLPSMALDPATAPALLYLLHPCSRPASLPVWRCWLKHLA